LKTVKGNQSSVFVCIIILMFLVFSGGCTSLKNLDLELEKESSPPPPDPIILAHPFTDVSVPGGFEKDQSKSFVYESGSGSVKVGRLFFKGSSNMEDTVEFFQDEMTNHGWTLVNSMTHGGKILNYQKEGSVCTVIIQSSMLGSRVEIQIGPK
tara:strand:- start:5990 stop:6448 length:459 start_codon:yes stop_codon:yes gene_type:complete